jgi:nucleoside-diphosphate-sugar epimerase
MTPQRQVALTGATGFIGSAVLSRLVANGWHVRALHRRHRGRTPASRHGVEWIEGDLGDPRSLAALVTGADAVVHCAGTVRGATSEGFERVNAEGTRRLLEAASASRAPRFLLMSSLAARTPDLSAYAASKRHGERVLEAAARNMRWTVLRPPAVYGPGDRELEPLFRWVARGVAPMPAGRAGRFSLIYVDDLASAVLRWLEVDGGYGRTFELDDGHPGGYDWDTVLGVAARVLLRDGVPLRRLSVPVSLLRLAAAANVVVSRVAGYDPMLTPGKVREITHLDWLCDSHDFVSATGWQADVGLDEGLARGYGRTHP